MKLDYADRFENSNQRDSVINQVKQQFIQLMDTNNPRHVMLFKQNFDFENYMNALARESIRKNDSTRLAEKTIEAQKIHQKNDSIINTIDWSKWTNYNKNNLIELVEKGEDIEPYVNFNPSTLSPDEYREYLALLDTTLHDFNDDYFTPDIGDDGRRFDTLDNVDLFTELLKINLDELKREYNTVSIINTQPRLIHLQKIVQLIGDRYISKQLIPNASQQSQIDSLLNFIEYNMMIDSNDLWESISIDLMYRLWFLGVPKIKSWIKTDNYALNRFLGQNLHYFADEAMVKELVQKFEDEYATGNKYEATSYLGPLQYIDFLKKVDKYELHLPPRRVPQRTFDQSQEWCEKYIYPAFVKVGWLVKVK
ncbi:MAG: hypothetical protein IPP01_05510 [Saprospiraceae bacterium]|nr:hypothetical protein [Saprospiraceae bacterium]